MIVQASSATFAIALIMCSKGWISFELAAAIMLGGNIGTCVTPLIASVSGNVQAKRTAMGHLLFNVLGSIWAIALYSPFIKLIVWISTMFAGDPTALATFADTLSPDTINALSNGTLDLSDPANQTLADNFAAKQYYMSFGLSMFHTVFNVINIFIMIWFTNAFVYIVTKMVPSRNAEDDDENHLQFISVGLLSTAELSILQAQKEITVYGKRVQRMFGLVRDLMHEEHEDEFVKKFSRIQKYENISDRMEVEIADYLTKVSDGRLSDDSKHQIQMKMRVISEIESVADSCYNLARTLLRKREGAPFPAMLTSNIELMFNLIDSDLNQMMLALSQSTMTSDDVNKTQNLENEINNFRNQLKTQNILDVNNGLYPYTVSVVYMDMIVECEKMGDYIINVVEAVADIKVRIEE